MRQMGVMRYKEGDYSSAFEYYTKAAALGDLNAHAKLAYLYFKGDGVEKDGEKKYIIWKKPPLVDMLLLDNILQLLR